jgi:hypothetical protein
MADTTKTAASDAAAGDSTASTTTKEEAKAEAPVGPVKVKNITNGMVPLESGSLKPGETGDASMAEWTTLGLVYLEKV